MRRIAFFIRHNNDLDHFSPIIWKWNEDDGREALIFLMNDDVSPNDFRIRFLRDECNVQVQTFPQLLRRTISNLGRLASVGCTPNEVIQELRRGVDDLVLVFDKNSSRTTLTFVKAARLMGVKSVSLPHGDDPFVNHMITIDDLNWREIRFHDNAELFSLYVFASKFQESRRQANEEANYLVLGQPRYSQIWLDKLDELLEPAVVPNHDDSLKILIFLRNAKYSFFHEEFVRLLSMVLQLPKVCVVAVRHPRRFLSEDEAGETREVDLDLPDPDCVPHRHETSKLIYADAGELHGSQWIAWSDVVFSLGTTVVYEAIQRGKPVIELEYLHPNRTVVGTIFKNADGLCRDHIYNWIRKFKESRDSFNSFYTDEELEEFHQLCINVGAEDVLGRYVETLEGVFDSGPIDTGAVAAK